MYYRCASFRAHSGISCIGYPIGNIFSGTDNVQAAQKFITGLDATRLSKFPEYSGCGVAAMRAKTVKKNNQQVANS
ncbi:hypothetical protein NC652_037991 [Populus alba x Populus x berolinensis]|nr:hypothetical protein NC652_037991 [Populus alba x Populus x berolinensis]